MCCCPSRRSSDLVDGVRVNRQMDLDRLWEVADQARGRARLSSSDVKFVRDIAPRQLDSFPRLKLPASIRHPAGFSVSGASVGTFVRSALLVAGQKALGRRFGGHRMLRARRAGPGVWHHALAFSSRVSEGRALLRPMHARGGARARGAARFATFDSRELSDRRYPARSETPMAIWQAGGSTNGALGIR